MNNKKMFLLGFLFLSFFSFTKDAYALTPVARFDVVPYQRIKHDNSFKVGVVAFSKPGIQKVEFSATGQGYSGGTKTSTTMSLNDRTGVWEYWVSFPASDFTGNGPVTINAKVTDKSGNYRNLTLDMIVEGASAFTPVTAWVSPTGNNSTCTVNNQSSPCQTVAGAISKIQAANGGNSNGAIIYLQEGTYSVANTTANTTNEWLTITKAPSANRDKVIIDTGKLSTGYLKYDNLTLKSRGSGLYVATESSTRLWTNDCRRIGSGTETLNSNPVHHSSENHYSTNDYTYNVDYGYRKAALVRGAELVQLGVDSFQNTSFVVDSTSRGQFNAQGLHADAYQVHTTGEPPANNRIVYNYKATDLHYQGIFARSDAGAATDNAFVNVFMEMREPPAKNESDLYSFSPVSFYQNWDHLILWNCTFVGHTGGMYGTYTNSSFVGNVFDAYVSTETNVGIQTLPSAEPGNSSNNEYLYNHFNQIYKETNSCTPNTVYLNRPPGQNPWPCPLWGAKKPDSGSPSTYTKNYGVLDNNYQSTTFGYPVQGSPLINRFTSRVPVDANNRVRGTMSDVGAYESGTDSTPPPPPPATCSDNIQNQGETGVDCGGPCTACAVPTYQCNDGADNDSDGLVDYPSDPGCSSATDDDEYNAPLPDTQPPTVPAGLVASVVSTSQINVSWNAATDNTGVAGYNLYRCAGTTCTPTTKLLTTTGTGFLNMGLTPNTTYRYRVTAFDAAGNTSGYSATVSATTQSEPVYACNDGIDNDGDGLIDYPNDPGCAAAIDNDEYDPPVTIKDTQAPSTPSGFSASNVTDSSLTLSWASSTDNVGVVGYNLYRCAGFRCTPVKIATTPNATYADAGLQSRTKYYYQVTAFDAAGNVSKLSSKYSVTTKRTRTPRLVSTDGLSSMVASLFFGAQGAPDDTLSKFLVGTAFLGVALAIVLYVKQRTQKKWLFFRKTSMQSRIVLYVAVGVVVLVVLLMML